jgi:hypothetical protein
MKGGKRVQERQPAGFAASLGREAAVTGPHRSDAWFVAQTNYVTRLGYTSTSRIFVSLTYPCPPTQVAQVPYRAY